MVVTLGNGRVSSLSSITCTYEWEIENHSSCNEMAVGEQVNSPSFNVRNRSWYMMLYPSGINEGSRGFSSLFLALDEDYGHEVHVKYAFSLIDNSKKVIARFTPKRVSTFIDACVGKGLDNFVDKSLLMNNTNNTSSNKITIVCEIVTEKVTVNKTASMVSLDKVQHFEGLKNLINNPKFSDDVKFIVQGKEIFAHKIMLTCNSPVFAAMFEHKMRENEDNTVKIKDMSYNIFYELLKCIYTGKCVLTNNILREVFGAADKYQVLRLRDICEKKLCKNIYNKNVIGLLQWADMHSAECLKKEAIEFIALHGKEFLDKPEFESLGNLNLNLLNDVLRGVFARIK